MESFIICDSIFDAIADKYGDHLHKLQIEEGYKLYAAKEGVNFLQRAIENDLKQYDPHLEVSEFKYDYEEESTEPFSCPVRPEPLYKVVT